MKKFLIVLIILLASVFSLVYFLDPFKAPNSANKSETFVVSEDADDSIITQRLKDQGFIKSFFAMDLVLTIKNKHQKIKAGGYYLSKSMDSWRVADRITGDPDMKWITFPEGLRKEQIGERFRALLNWNSKQLDDWNNTYTAMKFDYIEGVYFPDTYLIPVTDNGLEISKRMINRFNEKMAPYLPEFTKQDILWTTGIRMASLIQREAGSNSDMPIISAVLWNRLLKGQRLEIDATVQYAKGKTDGKWWSVVTPSDIRTIESPYNTYKNKGLPPHPIANPGINAIEAVLNPAKTDCLYYLHDHNRDIHCSVTYENHLKNIEKYLN